MNNIAENIKYIQDRIQNACNRANRNIEDIQFMAVSKFQEIGKIEIVYNCGIRLFGESRVQEATEKFTEFKGTHPDIDLHLIGNLQRNKAKTAMALFNCIQSVDRISLIEELGELTKKNDVSIKILLELHTGEESKNGFPDIDSLCKACEKIILYSNLIPSGLMTMAPYTDNKSIIRSSFRTLTQAQNKLKTSFPSFNWSCLSMGMTNDFEIAIEEGSTLVRIGTAIFGDR